MATKTCTTGRQASQASRAPASSRKTQICGAEKSGYATPQLKHKVQPTLSSPLQTFTLGDEAVHWHTHTAFENPELDPLDAAWIEEMTVSPRKKGDGELAFKDIVSVCLKRSPMFGSDQKQCILTDASGQKIKIASRHKLGFSLNGEDRTQTYAPLVRTLLARLAESNPNVRYVAGSTVMWALVLAICVGYFSMISLILFNGVSVGAGIGGFLLGVLHLPSMLRCLGRGIQFSFGPSEPPASYLD